MAERHQPLIILITDWVAGPGSPPRSAVARQAATANPVPVFCAGLGRADRALLTAVAGLTGGRAVRVVAGAAGRVQLETFLARAANPVLASTSISAGKTIYF